MDARIKSLSARCQYIKLIVASAICMFTWRVSAQVEKGPKREQSNAESAQSKAHNSKNKNALRKSFPSQKGTALGPSKKSSSSIQPKVGGSSASDMKKSDGEPRTGPLKAAGASVSDMKKSDGEPRTGPLKAAGASVSDMKKSSGEPRTGPLGAGGGSAPTMEEAVGKQRTGSPETGETPESGKGHGTLHEQLPVTKTGSLTPDVYFEDLSYHFRVGAGFGGYWVSPHDKNRVMASSGSGQIFISEDGGLTFTEIQLIAASPAYYAEENQSRYLGALRSETRTSISEGAFSLPSRPVFRHPSLLQRPSDDIKADNGTRRAKRRGNLGAFAHRLGRHGWDLTLRSLVSATYPGTSSIMGPVFHPTNPLIIWMLTFNGLYKSTDGGWTYTRVFIGNSTAGKSILDFAFDPQNNQRAFLGTGEGLYISNDGAKSFLRHTGKGIGDWPVWGIKFHPRNPRVVFACTEQGLLRSKDGGDNWELIYWSTYMQGRFARAIEFDPNDPNKAFLNTYIGIFHTDDIMNAGIDSWKPFAPNLFTGMAMRTFSICPKHRGHMWVLTQRAIPSVRTVHNRPGGNEFIYETIDGGKTWHIIYTPLNKGTLWWFVNDPNDPDLLLIYSSGGPVKMRRRKANGNATSSSQSLALDEGPTPSEVMQAALQFTGLDPRHELDYRHRARQSALLPRVELKYFHGAWSDYFKINNALWPNLPYRFNQSRNQTRSEFLFFLSWDLNKLIFNPQQTLSGRITRQNMALREQILSEVQQAYHNIRQFKARLSQLKSEDLYLRLMYRLRIEEYSSLINFLTGDYLKHWKKHG